MRFAIISNSGLELRNMMTKLDQFTPTVEKLAWLELDGRVMKLTKEFTIQDIV
jgi:hypothetical protein